MVITDAAAMQSLFSSAHQNSQDSDPSGALGTVDLKLTHLDWNPEDTLIHFQGQYVTICELDYNILQGEIQNIPKTKTAVDVGEFCLVEDLTSAHWYRGRVQNRKEDLFEVFLIDHGNILSVDIAHISSCSNDLFVMPPKIVCGFLANVLLLHASSFSVVEKYLSSLIGRNITGYIRALLSHRVLLLETPDINSDLVRHGFGRHVDTDTFLFLVELLTDIPLKQNRDPGPGSHNEKPWGRESCYKYEEILSFCGPRLSCGTRAKVRVTAAVNPRLFFCQMASADYDLWEISKKLAAVCEHKTKDCHQTTAENLGLLCSIKDEKWYRGFLQSLPVNSQVRVLFIDYGFFKSVNVENVHRLPPDLYSTPIMAFPCSLSSHSGHDEAVKTQQLSFLKSGLLGRVLDVEISSFDEEQHLYSITVVEAGDNEENDSDALRERPTMKVKSVFETPPLGGLLYYETVMGQALAKTLEEEEVQVDSMFVGYVEYSQNPSNFWIRTQKRNDEFAEMMDQMADHFSQVKLDEDVLFNPELGKLCCAVYEKDMHFYRGVVIDILEHGAEVLFMDFGNIEKVPHMLIKKIPEAFARKPAFAICCSLVNICPVDELWSNLSSDFFRQAVSNKALLIHVVHMRKSKFFVDLHEIGSDDTRSISELLVSSKQADFWKNISIEPMVQNKKGKRCPGYSVPSDTSDETGWKDRHQEKESDKHETEAFIPVPTSFKAFGIRPGCEFAVCCSYINSPGEFWCQQLEEVPVLEELMSKLQQYYTTHTAPLQDDDLCCVAKSPQDGKWYRAFIAERRKGYVEVLFVDYGFTFHIKEPYLQKIMPEFVDLAGQAFRCSLDHLIEPVENESHGGWNVEICNYLKEFSNDSIGCLRCNVVLQLRVKNKELHHVVDLYNTRTQQSLTKLLLERGLAREATDSTKQMSAAVPESFVYSSFDLSLKDQEQVFVTHVSSQWEVYCQLERNLGSTEELEKKISEESEKMKQANMKAVGKLCLARYLDGNWYRGLAHPVQSPRHLGVFFVDYGNTNITDNTQIMFIPKESDRLLYIPMQAVKFNLASVSREELYVDVKEWLEGAILNKEVRAVIVGKCADGSFDVELFHGDVNINQKVKELICSLSSKPQMVVRTVNKAHTRETSVKVKSQRRGPSLTFPASSDCRGTHVRSGHCRRRENTKSYEDGSSQMKNRKVNQQTLERKGSCAKTKDIKDGDPVKPQINCQGQVQMQQHIRKEQPQHSEKPEIPKLPCLLDMQVSAGCRMKCFVSHVNSIKNFYLQRSDDEPAILKMAEDLNSGTGSLKSAHSLKINDFVLALYEEDGALYRAVVKDSEWDSCFKMEFVDYGNSVVMDTEKIYSLPKEFLSQPRFSIPCSLLDTSMYDSDASFTDAVMEKPLMVHFVHHSGGHWDVQFEILDGAVVCPVTPEPAVEIKKEVPASWSLSKKGEKIKPCEQTSLVVGEDEKRTEDETVIKDVKLKPPPVTLSIKQQVKSSRRRRTHYRNGRRIQTRTAKLSVKTPRKCVYADGITPTIRAKDVENGVLLSVLCDGEFYVRLNKTNDLLAVLERYIAANICKWETVAEEDIKQGLKCLVQVQRHNWWKRGVVQHVDQGKYQVLLVDDGLTEEISSGLIRRECSEATSVPNLAVLCKMNWLSSGESDPKLCCEALKPSIGKEVKLVFVSYSEIDSLWMVEISYNGLSLVNNITPSLQKKEEIVQSPAETQIKPSEKLILDLSPHQHLAFAPVSIDESYSGFAAAMTTPFEFCVILENLLPIMNQVSIMLDDLTAESFALPEAHLIPGTCCMLKSHLKNKWCRAEIVHADTTMVLNLVDYGHFEDVPYTDHLRLKRLPEDLMKLPKVTYPCILRGVKPVGPDGQWSAEGTVFFQQCLHQKNCQIFFREFVSNTHWKVDILSEGVHVAKKLVDAQHADYIDDILGLRFQEQSRREALPQSPDSEEDQHQEAEGSDRNLDLSVEADEEEQMPLSDVPGSNQCFQM